MPLQPLQLDITAIDQSPLPLDISLVKDHLAVIDDDSNALIEKLILAAINWAEGTTRRTIYSRSHTWILRDFPRDGCEQFRLPRGKTQSVESIVYSLNGSTATLYGPSSSESPATAGFQESLTGDDGGYLMPLRGESWPSVDYDVPAPVIITFTAGWLAAEVPADVEHAMLFAVSDSFELRGSGDLDRSGSHFEIREALISSYRLKRWY